MVIKLLEATVPGTINPDGSLELDEPVDVAPGRVQVTVRRSRTSIQSADVRLSGPPWIDEASSPPFDLPRPTPVPVVLMRRGIPRLPDAIFDEVDS